MSSMSLDRIEHLKDVVNADDSKAWNPEAKVVWASESSPVGAAAKQANITKSLEFGQWMPSGQQSIPLQSRSMQEYEKDESSAEKASDLADIESGLDVPGPRQENKYDRAMKDNRPFNVMMKKALAPSPMARYDDPQRPLTSRKPKTDEDRAVELIRDLTMRVHKLEGNHSHLNRTRRILFAVFLLACVLVIIQDARMVV